MDLPRITVCSRKTSTPLWIEMNVLIQLMSGLPCEHECRTDLLFDHLLFHCYYEPGFICDLSSKVRDIASFKNSFHCLQPKLK